MSQAANRKISGLNGIGSRIKDLRLKKGLSQTGLAHLIGCAPNTINEWEKRSGRAPGKKLIGQLAQTLETSVDYLLGGECLDKPKIPYYGEVSSEEFDWPDTSKPKYHLEVFEAHYSPERFSFKVLDDLLEPTICKDDYCIFEKLLPENGDIVIARFPGTNKAIIRMWRQQDEFVMLSETKLTKIFPSYFLEIREFDENLSYILKNQQEIVIEGKLVGIKKSIQLTKRAARVRYL